MRAKWLVIGVTILALAGFLWTMMPYRPYIRLRERRTLVGPEDEAIKLLLQGASNEKVKAAVRKAGQPVDRHSYQGATLLAWAVEEQRRSLAEWLLQEGAEANGTPLKAAVYKKDVEMVKLLIEHGADPDRPVLDDLTARKIAEMDGLQDILSVMPPKTDNAP